jgi:hypothetical protein
MIPILIYVLCVLTCAACAFLLWRAYRRSRSKLLFWSALCFVILGVSNLLMFADLVIYPGISLLLLRNVVTLTGLLVLIYGLIFESQ